MSAPHAGTAGALELEARQDHSTQDVFSGRAITGEGTPELKPSQTLVVAGATASFQEPAMDLVLVLVTVGFFALSWAYTHACERL